MQNYIGDGYEQDAYIAELKGIHSEVRFTFRPLRYDQHLRLLDGFGGLKPEQRAKRIFQTIAKKLIKWDVIDSKGHVCAINAETLSRLRPKLADPLFNIIAGIDGSDDDPEKIEDTPESMDDLDAILDGKPNLEADEKNSEAA